MTPATVTERSSEPTADKTAIRPFQVNVPEDERSELRRRVLAARLPERETVADFSHGVPLDTVKKLARAWVTEYNWRRVEACVAETSADADGLSAFLNVRPRLLGIACRMLGSAAAAEDIVQDVWVRWQTTDRSVVRDPPAFLATTTTRLAINVIKSARSRRETYMGPSLPEPVDTSADPALGAERSEALQFAVVLLERLSPMQRAAYVLREAFDYSYREIADILRLEEANARQLVTRARQHVVAGRCAPAQHVPCDRGGRNRACRRWLASQVHDERRGRKGRKGRMYSLAAFAAFAFQDGVISQTRT
jgi:RNA polymerase sigma factor (sigma-70 family)